MDAALTTLIVDDEPVPRLLLKQALRRADFPVSGAAALARLSELQPALVVLEVSMPEMSGFEVVEKMR
jgi:CheY-like chemotaxis protein